MRKILLLTAIVSLLCAVNSNAQDVINLSTTDNIGTVLSTYSGTNVVVIVPTGYTNPQAANAIAIPVLTAGAKITIKGDGSMPNLAVKTLTLPAGINLSALKFDGLNLTGATTDPTANYVINVATGTAVNLDTVSFNNCNISTFRSLVRFQSTNTTIDQSANHILFNNCKVSNFADYGIVYNNKVGGSFGPIVATNSTFYGITQCVFMCQTNTASVSISDCTFDNAVLTAAKFIVDLNAQTSPITVTNCIFGKTLSGAGSFRTGGTLAITNSYTTTDWAAVDAVATAGITGSLTAYTSASAVLFKTPNTSTPGTAFVNTADYTIIDANFAGAGNAGDPRNRIITGVISPKASSMEISIKGTDITLSENSTIRIFNTTGELVKSAENSNYISVASLAKGIYIVKAGSEVQKFAVR